MRKKLITYAGLLCLAAVVLSLKACTVRYTFSGVSISSEVKTFSVDYIQNRAALVQPILSQTITDALIDKCRNQTNLEYVSSNGDVHFEGEITDYKTQPMAITGDEQAALNRFTISVKVRFTNAVDEQWDYESSFSRYSDYPSSQDLSQVESELMEEVVELLVEDIFNKAFVNW